MAQVQDIGILARSEMGGTVTFRTLMGVYIGEFLALQTRFLTAVGFSVHLMVIERTHKGPSHFFDLFGFHISLSTCSELRGRIGSSQTWYPQSIEGESSPSYLSFVARAVDNRAVVSPARHRGHLLKNGWHLLLDLDYLQTRSES